MVADAGNTTVNDSLAVTATGAEKDAATPTATSAAANQSIGIDNVQTQTDLNFQTSGQSIWNTGPTGANKNFDDRVPWSRHENPFI